MLHEVSTSAISLEEGHNGAPDDHPIGHPGYHPYLRRVGDTEPHRKRLIGLSPDHPDGHLKIIAQAGTGSCHATQ
jgi:hypothetical protein